MFERMKFLLILNLTAILITVLIFGTACSRSVVPMNEETRTLEAIEKSETAEASETVMISNYHEQTPQMVGVWISYIELSPILTGKSELEFRAGFSKIVHNCESLGINTLFVHLRPFGDALYRSEHYSWSKYVTGEIAAIPDYDPLEVMLEVAHSQNLEFHGWLNPLRIGSDSDIEAIPTGYKINEWYNDKRGEFVAKHGDYWYLNPAYSEVLELISAGAEELTRNYSVDGVHIDDYFYPTTNFKFDEAACKAFKVDTDAVSISEFRKNNINTMVKGIYSAVKAGNPAAVFGISPQGSIENNENQLYADVKTWCKTPGFADYIAPQFYYGFDNSSQPYTECIKKWQEIFNESEASNPDIKLIFGLSVYKIGQIDEWAGETGSKATLEWLETKEILRRQIEESRRLRSYGGVIFYSYNYLFNPEYLNEEIEAEIAAFKPILEENNESDKKTN